MRMNLVNKKKNEKEELNGFETDSLNTYSDSENSIDDLDNDHFKNSINSNKTAETEKDAENFTNFDWYKYINYHKDLRQLNTKEKAWDHWINHGKKEQRKFFKLNVKEDKLEKTEKKIEEKMEEIDNFKDFDWYKYVNYHKDLNKINNKEKAWEHWINYGKKEQRKYFSFINITEDEYKNFDWENYVNNYEDLKTIKTKKDAWDHWINHGKKEKRITYNIREKKVTNNVNEKKNDYNHIKKITFKKVYECYENGYHSWENVINQFVLNLKKQNNETSSKLAEISEIKENISNSIFAYYKDNYLFDEWIEKLFLSENKNQSDEYLDSIKSKKYKLISFLHDPPCLKLTDNEYKNSISKNMIINDKENNENTLNNSLNDHLEFLYVLSNDHKKYIYKNYPKLEDKIVSVYRPINMKMKKIEKKFDFALFKNEKNIFHIGEFLSNFKTFIDFNPSKKFRKNILINNELIEDWNNQILKHNKIDDINIVNELSNEDYLNIFEKSCIFIDYEDCVSSNLILECLKYNTPFIIKHNKSIEEYVGRDYPLYFKNSEDLTTFSDKNKLLTEIKNANNYLKNLNKNHIELDTFNKKISYEFNKLKVNTLQYKLTWVCILKNEFSLDSLKNLINNFTNQEVQKDLQLIFITHPLLNIEKVNNKMFSYDNIQLFEMEDKKEWIYKIDTEYILMVNLTDTYKINYSKICVDHLNEKPTNDILFSSFKKINKNHENQELENDDFENQLYKYKKGMYFTDDTKNMLPNSGFVFRKSLIDVLDISFIFMKNKDMYDYFIINHLNVVCISEKPLFLTEII